ncbi:hypothetical protein [Micromonospora sp. NPDC093277]|uniref:hypothetical protein n=1 Tax=Micromonospora sp. NPDC093277 TaxID=3364291 RepID=UPI003829EC30
MAGAFVQPQLSRDGMAHRVPSPIRVNGDERFGEIITQRQLPLDMAEEEPSARPAVFFGAPRARARRRGESGI